MVPHQAEVGALPDEVAALVRLRPVADGVAEAPDRIRALGFDRLQHRSEGMAVSVDV